MDDNLAKIIVVAVIGITISVSMIAQAIASVLKSKRRRELPDAGVASIEERLERMELAIDAIATEVERVSEGQRFTSRLLAERQAERQT